MSRTAATIVALGTAVLLLGLLSLSVGRVWIPLSLWGTPGPLGVLLFELRLPRTLLAVIVGATLGLGGAALQGYTRNPLADPGLLGVSAMASLGAVLSLYFSLTSFWLLPTMAIGGAGVGVLLLLALAGLTGGTVTFVLAGVVLQTVAGAGIALALSLAPNPWASGEIIKWLMGSLQDRSVDDLRYALPLALAGGALVLATAPALDALTLGEAGARSLGARLGRARLMLVVGVGLATGVCVAATGVIGFVGLIVPHLLRPLVGARPSALLVPSALGGAALMLAADMAVRLLPTAEEVRLGVALSALGAPFFLALVLTLRRRLL
jgi:iron complex transport system permease protein